VRLVNGMIARGGLGGRMRVVGSWERIAGVWIHMDV
jgi:hypothetical protein